MRSSAEINVEIHNYGAAFFKAVREEILTHATWGPSLEEQNANRTRLESAIETVMDESVFRPDLSHDDLWQILWGRVTYAGTLAAKATEEISCMRASVPLFRNLDYYVEDRFVFDEVEWGRFKKHWQSRYPGANWLNLAKEDPEWAPEVHFKNTTPEVWKILIKDQIAHPGLKFSSHAEKVKKYLKIARLLHGRRASNNPLALSFYTDDGYRFKPEHLTGSAWVEERKKLVRVRKQLSDEVGTLTAMHSMLDMGLKTIKPDRVLTYLFSQLGWLQTLPSTLSKTEVLKLYNKEEVIDEMTVRSDVFANRLEKEGYRQTHRLLDIWLVKYGQEPEPAWGITVNLQKQRRNIAEVFNQVKVDYAPKLVIDASLAAQMWPSEEFVEIPARATRVLAGKKIRTRSEIEKNFSISSKVSRASIRLPEAEAIKRFMEQWKTGTSTHPDIYPNRLDNRSKDAIIRLISRGKKPEEAFLSVLQKTK